MKNLFPYEKDIPAEMLEGIPVAGMDYLLAGRVEGWKGPFREVSSPVLIQGAGGLSRKCIGSVPSMDEEASLGMLRHAREAYSDGMGVWPRLPAAGRAERMSTFIVRMEESRERIVRLLQWEIGKTAGDAAGEFDRSVAYARGCVEVFERCGGKPGGLVVDNGIAGRLERVPRGVVLIMGPFNYPLFETMTAFAPAMLAGNTVVIKPPRLGCLFFQYLLRAARDVFPVGSVNIVYGDGRRIIPPLLSSGMVDLFYFIGTSPVAGYLKGLHPKPHRLKCILGLEAKNPAIVLPDADMDRAASECIRGALTFNGQRCAALKIFFVHRSVAGEFNERLSEAVRGLKHGMPWEDGVFVTPLAEHDRAQYLSGLVEDAMNLGAGIVNEGGGETTGTFFSPAVMYPASTHMRVCREEQFGPVVPVVPYDDIDESLRYITESPYGQQVSLFGKDRETLKKLTEYLVHHVSRVNINCQCQRSPDTVPFTGRKDSAEGSLSISEAVDAFTVPTFIATRNADGNVDIIEEL
ncbi:MAG TPA: aldehyde dehydrogenase family protein [Syntrophorhabdaceae bacterium]|nr:aldehyde dehydrogenase family protein [Syntrophorhabdaceae bacterium]